ncbi:unnamed protein product [Allacma fusca]|uniref:Ionotropic receptor n=1 Tax=Allacma fusca TaxID=39272 RepID=A0A8J2LF76_9HEXA|nr:unnamed protein product [Allacma fusca]
MIHVSRLSCIHLALTWACSAFCIGDAEKLKDPFLVSSLLNFFTPSQIHRTCEVILTSPHATLPIKIQELFTLEIPKKIISQNLTQRAAKQTLKFTGNCFNVVLFDNLKFDKVVKTLYLVIPIRQPEQIHYVFILTRETLQENKSRHDWIRKEIKYSTEIIFHVNGTLLAQKWFEDKISYLRCGIIRKHPFSIWSNGRNLGWAISMIEEIQTHYNLTIDPDYNHLGYSQLSNGSWPGFMQDFMDGTLDFIVTFSHTYERESLGEYSTPILYSPVIFITLKPTASLKWLAIFYPFSSMVWVFLALSSLTTVLVLGVEFKIFKKKDPFFRALLIPFAAILQQSLAFNSRSFLGIVFLFMSVILNTYYNSNFLAYVTSPTIDEVPRSFEELSNARDYNIVLTYLPGDLLDEFLKTTNVPAYSNVRKRSVPEKEFPKCAVAVLNDKTVCIGYEFILNSLLAENLTLDHGFDPVVRSSSPVMSLLNIGFTRGFKHLQFFNGIIAYLRDTGLISKWVGMATEVLKNIGKDWMRSLENTQNYRKLLELRERLEDRVVKPLGWLNFQLTFSGLVFGGCLSLIAFIWEKIYDDRRIFLRRRRRHPQ